MTDFDPYAARAVLVDTVGVANARSARLAAMLASACDEVERLRTERDALKAKIVRLVEAATPVVELTDASDPSRATWRILDGGDTECLDELSAALADAGKVTP